MASIPLRIKESEDMKRMIIAGLVLKYQGKVRENYEIPGYPDYFLQCASDRISIFDFVLNALVYQKGEILTALTHFWLTGILKDFPNHLVSSLADPQKNAVHDLKPLYPDIPLTRSFVVKKMEIPPWEMVFRFHLGGSVYQKYQEKGTVAGIPVTPGHPKWSAMSAPLFTPAAKLADGHDENKDVAEYLTATGVPGQKAMTMFADAYVRAYEFAKKKGILILDTKFEGENCFCDEVFTPDSSRFTTVEDFKNAIAEKRDPVSYDKQVTRNWGLTVKTLFSVTGINNLDPKNPDHIAYVHSLVVPEDVIEQTRQRYHKIFRIFTGKTLGDYQMSKMQIF
jgi:phosphoribosylaminoimidazole-succinocarboxamide synthase